MGRFGERETRMSSVDEVRGPGAVSTLSEARFASERIASVIGDMRYGTVEITIHDGKVVQIDRTERIRIPNDSVRSRSR